MVGTTVHHNAENLDLSVHVNCQLVQRELPLGRLARCRDKWFTSVPVVIPRQTSEMPLGGPEANHFLLLGCRPAIA
jgi:hypothetical protein